VVFREPYVASPQVESEKGGFVQWKRRWVI
jgi:hypothetical protein